MNEFKRGFAAGGGGNKFLPWFAAGCVLICPVSDAAGIHRNGVGAEAMSLGGAGVASPAGPLGALHANPAGLRLPTEAAVQVGAFGGLATGDYDNSAGDGDLKRRFGGLPEAAVAYPLESMPVTFGLGVFADAALLADWQITDPPGGLGGTTSYGLQRHRSQIVALRTAFGFGLEINEHLLVGASLGAVYNINELQSPYIFQQTPGLAGAKTLLDLETDGWGWNMSLGVLYRPHERLQLGVSYQSPTAIDATGRATGDAGAQLGVASFPFTYDAEVANELPQIVSLGASWQATGRLRTVVQLDWINWADAFDELEISLGNGSNPGLPASLQDVIPLDWRDQWVIRAGLEFAATERLWLRAGYAWGANPVPAGTLTPMTAAIMEHTVSAGVEWREARWSVACAYQYDLPSTESAGVSRLGVEYDGTRTRVALHWLGLTTTWRF